MGEGEDVSSGAISQQKDAGFEAVENDGRCEIAVGCASCWIDDFRPSMSPMPRTRPSLGESIASSAERKRSLVAMTL